MNRSRSGVEPLPFATRRDLRAWFERHAPSEDELWILFYKRHTGVPSVNYAQALEEALCFGWIDGKVMRVDEATYKQRWTPRRPESVWSAVNVRKAKALIAAGRMTKAGLAAFAKRDRSASHRYSYENRPRDLPPDALARLKRNPKAWEFWQEQPPGYRRTATWYVVEAKREETRNKRLAFVIAYSSRGERIPLLVSPGKTAKPKKTRSED